MMHIIDPSIQALIILLANVVWKTRALGLCCHTSSREPLELPLIKDVTALDTIDRFPCDESSIEVLKSYEERRIPVILVNCDIDWPARQSWTLANLTKRIESDSKFRVVLLEDTHVELSERIEFKFIIDAYQQGHMFYIFDNLNTTIGQTLENDYTVPPHFQYDLFSSFKTFPLDDYGPMRWFAAGSRLTGTFAHVDPFATDAWNTVLHGQKWWILFPPSAHTVVSDDGDYQMIGCDNTCSDESVSIADYYKAIWSNPSALSEVFDGEVNHVMQKEGETLYIPSNIIHSVMNVANTVAITKNYASYFNIQNIWDMLNDYEVDQQSLTDVYCTVLSNEQRMILDYNYDCYPKDVNGEL